MYKILWNLQNRLLALLAEVSKIAEYKVNTQESTTFPHTYNEREQGVLRGKCTAVKFKISELRFLFKIAFYFRKERRVNPKEVEIIKIRSQ